jgi:hypothetical protein
MQKFKTTRATKHMIVYLARCWRYHGTKRLLEIFDDPEANRILELFGVAYVNKQISLDKAVFYGDLAIRVRPNI